MKLLLLILTLTSIIFAQNKIEPFKILNKTDSFQCLSMKYNLQINSVNINLYHPNLSEIPNECVDYFFLKENSIGFTQKIVYSDSVSKKSRAERRLERKNRRLQEIADKYTIDELKERINNYKRSKTSGTVLMGIGIPIFAGGLLSTIVGLNNIDRSNSSSSDDGWAVTALVGEIVAAAGGIITAYGIIKMSKANSRINKYKELLEIKTKDVGIRINRKGLSLCYHF